MAFTETLGGGVGLGGGMLKSLAGGALGIAAAANSFFRVREGEVALKENKSGKVVRDADGIPKIYLPGVHVMMPGFQHYKKISIQDRIEKLEDIEISRDKQVRVESGFTWGVTQEGAYPALYLIDTVSALEKKVLSIGRRALWSTLMEVDERVLLSANLTDEIYERVEEKCRAPMMHYGTEMRGLEVIASKTKEQVLGEFFLRSSSLNTGDISPATLLSMNEMLGQPADGNGSSVYAAD